ncbi:MAG: DUF4254 domain-containing protein, partial [Bacteroidota bacterium]
MSILEKHFKRAVTLAEQRNELLMPSSPTLDDLYIKLCYTNLMQWKLEDEARRKDLSEEEFRAVIGSIQSSNSDRTKVMERIDHKLSSLVRKDLSQAKESSSSLLYHQTLGQVLDILSILHVRYYHAERAQTVGLEAP